MQKLEPEISVSFTDLVFFGQQPLRNTVWGHSNEGGSKCHENQKLQICVNEFETTNGLISALNVVLFSESIQARRDGHFDAHIVMFVPKNLTNVTQRYVTYNFGLVYYRLITL